MILDCKYLSLRNVVAEMWDEIEVEPSTQSKVAEGGTKATVLVVHVHRTFIINSKII